MQIEIHLAAKDDTPLAFNYYHELSSALYQCLSEKADKMAAELHGGGSKSRLKLFVTSPLNSDPHPEILPKNGGLVFGKHIWMRFGSIIPEILFGMSEGLLLKGEIQVRGKRFLIQKIDLVKPPVFEKMMTYHPFGQAGMILCRYSRDRKVFFQFPDNPEKEIPACSILLAENLRHKLLRLKEVRPDIFENLLTCSGVSEEKIPKMEIGVKILPLTPKELYRTGIYYIKKVPARAFRAPVQISAPNAIHRIAWSCGIGSQNSQGFGLLTLGKQGGEK